MKPAPAVPPEPVVAALPEIPPEDIPETPRAWTCAMCGAILPPETERCDECGSVLTRPAQFPGLPENRPVISLPPASLPAASFSAPPVRRILGNIAASRRVLPLAAALVLVIVVIVVAVVLVGGGHSAAEQTAAAVDTSSPQSPVAQAEEAEAVSLLRNAMTVIDAVWIETADFDAINSSALQTMDPSITWLGPASAGICAAPAAEAQVGDRAVSWAATGRASYEIGTRSASGRTYGARVDKLGGGTTYYVDGAVAAW